MWWSQLVEKLKSRYSPVIRFPLPVPPFNDYAVEKLRRYRKVVVATMESSNPQPPKDVCERIISIIDRALDQRSDRLLRALQVIRMYGRRGGSLSLVIVERVEEISSRVND